MSSAPSTQRTVAPWALITLAIGVLALVVGLVRFDALPDPYPTHFGPGGSADEYGDKTYAAVLAPLLIGQLSALAVLGVALAVPQKARRIVQPLGALALAIGGGISLLQLAQYLSPGAVPPGWTFWALLAVIILVTVWLVVAAVRVEAESGKDVGDDERHWKLGVLYVNPDDEKVMVPKRSGLGTTINFGRPMGWVVMALILAPGIVLIAYVGTLG